MLGLPLNEVHILYWILFMFLSDFKAQEMRSIPRALMMKFFHADANTTVHPLLVSWYFSSILLW